MSREQALAWLHAWCTRSLPSPPPSASSSSSSPASLSTRPYGGQSGSTTAYAARLQARPGLPVGVTSLPISPTLTDQGARLVCEGLGPAFLDVEVLENRRQASKISLVVRQCMGQAQMQQHSLSIRGLARDTEKTVLEKLESDMVVALRGGEGEREGVGVEFRTGSEAEAMEGFFEAVPASSEAVDVDDEHLEDKGLRQGPGVEGEGQGSGRQTKSETGPEDRVEKPDKEEEDARLRELIETLGLAEALDLEERGEGGEGGQKNGWADPNSPFAKKAVAAYEAFVQAQKGPGAEQGGDVASAVAGMGDVVMEELRERGAGGGGTPEDVKAMFESGLRSAKQEADRVAAKGQRQKQMLAVVKEVAETRQREVSGKGGVKEGLATLEMMFEGTGLKGGVDVMAGPPGEEGMDLRSWERGAEEARVGREGEARSEEVEEDEDEDEWDEALGSMGDADPLGDLGWDVAARFDVLVRELEATVDSPDLLPAIASQYHNVFLSRHFLGLMRARLEACEAAMAGEEDGEGVTAATPVVLARMVRFAEQMVVQVQEMGQLYELQQLDKIKAICAVAEEDMGRLSEYVSSRKEDLDEDFVRYLQYLMEAEKLRLRGAGVTRPEREPSNWLMILEIVKKGVYHELGKAVRDDVSMVHFITRFDEADEREHLTRAHVARLAPSQVIPFKRVVNQMVDHFESRVNELSEAELSLAGRVLEVEDVLEEIHPDSSLLALLQSKEGGVGLEAYKTGAETLLHDPREWDDSAVAGREDELFSPEYLAAKYDRILKHYGFSASRQRGRGMGQGDEEEEERKAEIGDIEGILGENPGTQGALPAALEAWVGTEKTERGQNKEKEEHGVLSVGAASIEEALREEGLL
ncbi:hypothetical protein NSK_000790 [Nannochloropsis salina CCMP1776]|uniref:Uncharacterized protein n=1 Tax=Nannochloropsis salina CCMP1776 TaxID=1027361 RepID=A0A4D9D958_9STRA|nr:hypothetical protein NSK_000790 [Nannochloropsis salina CCMP1776]|eukprot:TFJ87970.1 hypothetical protein NSK_000790 [Nannochloropsis salina CCMP1776]